MMISLILAFLVTYVLAVPVEYENASEIINPQNTLGVSLFRNHSMDIKKPVHLIAAVSQNNGIGLKGQLPWRLKKEMNYFTRMTQRTSDPSATNAVVMGRKTWESIPPKYKPLDKRMNVVISTTIGDFGENILAYSSVEEAITELRNVASVETIWMIGGYHTYKECLDKALWDKLYLTRIHKEFECDTFFPSIPKDSYAEISDPNVPREMQEENGITYEFKVYERVK